jgi:hypothetical protein
MPRPYEAAEGRRGRHAVKLKIRSGDPAMQWKNKGNISLSKNTTKTIDDFASFVDRRGSKEGQSQNSVGSG